MNSDKIPDGYQLVPKEPTNAMLNAATRYDYENPTDPTWVNIYKVMLAASEQESLKIECKLCLNTGFIPKAAIIPEQPDVKCPNGCRPVPKGF